MIVVTGAAGFIGSNLVAALEEDHPGRIAACDSFGSDERWQNLAKRELAAIVSPEALLPFLERNADGVAAVVHLGAISATTERDVDLLVAQNVRPTLDLWHWCARAGKPFIYASSAATYGDGAAGFDDDGSPRGLARLRPLNAYAWSKHVVDRRIARLVEEGAPAPPQWVGLKLFNVFGPNEYHKGTMRSVALQVFERAAAGEPARLFRSHHAGYDDGGQLRDFLWVEDCVAVIRWLLRHRSVNGLFNLGTGRARSFADLAHAVFAAMAAPVRIEYVDMPADLRPRYQYFTEAKMDRLRAAGYTSPFTSLEDGVAEYVRRYLTSGDRFR